jgi:hypothetical protein
MLGTNLCGCITSGKDIQSAFTIAGSSNASLEMADKDCRWPKRFEPYDQARDHGKEIGLWTIHEESQEQ